VDRFTDKDIRHSAQTVFGIIILGGGPVIGGWLSGFLQEYYTANGVFNFSNFWYTIAGLSILTTLFFFTSFREEPEIGNQG